MGTIRLLRHVNRGKHLLQMLDLGQIVDRDIRLIGMKSRVILVIIFSRIEPMNARNFRDDPPLEYFGAIELIDVRLGDALLLIAVVENDGAILRSAVRSLAVQLRGIVGDRKEYSQELAQGDLRRIVSDLH